MKDNIVRVDFVDQRGRVQQKNRVFRLIGGKLLPGEKLTLRRDSFDSPNIHGRLLAKCLQTGTLLVERDFTAR